METPARIITFNFFLNKPTKSFYGNVSLKHTPDSKYDVFEGSGINKELIYSVSSAVVKDVLVETVPDEFSVADFEFTEETKHD